jgi:hypothetical protein
MSRLEILDVSPVSALFRDGIRDFCLKRKDLEIRIENLKEQGIPTERECLALAEMNRQRRIEATE